LTFVLHLLFVNTMLGTGIIALVSHLKKPKTDLPVSADISKKLPYTIAFTVNMATPLLFLQVLYGHFFYVSSVLMAVYWILIIALLLIAYHSAYIYDFKYAALGGPRLFSIGANRNCKVRHTVDMEEEMHHPNSLGMMRSMQRK
jgi:hypothetical protein